MKKYFIILFISNLFFSNCFSEDLDLKENLVSKAPTKLIIKGAPFESSLKEISSSASVLQEEDLIKYGNEHLQNIFNQVPSLNFSGGTSRPRFFQIRGIGELEQYEGAPNPSVGLYIDDVDFSSLGSIATLFDVDQVEVHKGPQSIRYGANALAGVIDIRSKDPSSFRDGKVVLGAGSDDMHQGGAAMGGAIPGTNNKLFFRVSAFHHYQDGFRNNLFLDRDDTNQREETTLRSKLLWKPNSKLSAKLSVFSVNTNNGYDVFAIDNSFNTQSDRPGIDSQDSIGGSLKINYSLSDNLELESLTTGSISDNEYSFDGDWGNNPFWEPNAPYDFFQDSTRNRDVYRQELRLRTSDKNYTHGESYKHLFGLYFQNIKEDTNIKQFQDNIIFDDLDTAYKAKTYALFGQTEVPVAVSTSLTFGLRLEHRDADYRDSRSSTFSPNHDMIGGNLSLNHDLNENLRAYALVSRGFKGGGFNANPSVPLGRQEYDPEYLWNYEIGLKGNWLENKLQTNFSAFYQDRRNVQVSLGFQSDPSDPLSFLFITDNAIGGESIGFEGDFNYQLSSKLNVKGGVSLLSTEFKDFSIETQSLSGRQSSHAPSWQYVIGAEYKFTQNVFMNANVVGRDAFFFDDTHNQKSSPYNLVNLSLGYRTPKWSWTFWARNLFDKNYAVRGFFFGNEPPDFPNREYVQLGDPQRFGTNLTWYF